MVTAEFLPTAVSKLQGRYSLVRPLFTLLWEQSHGANLLVPALPTSVHLPTLKSRQASVDSALPPRPTLAHAGPLTNVHASARPCIEHDGVKVRGSICHSKWHWLRRPSHDRDTPPPLSMISSILTFPKVCDSRHYCCIPFLHRLPEPRCCSRGVSVLIPKFISRPGPVQIPNHPMCISCHRALPVTSHRITSGPLRFGDPLRVGDKLDLVLAPAPLVCRCPLLLIAPWHRAYVD